jgi:hypothetical protein
MTKQIVAIAILTATICGGGSALAADAPAQTPAKRPRFLLLDSRIIEKTENAQLTVGTVQKDRNNPLFRGGQAVGTEVRQSLLQCDI